MAADRSVRRLDPEQLHRLKQRNHELMQRTAQAAAAKQHEEEKRSSRLTAVQEQVCTFLQIIAEVINGSVKLLRGCSSYGRALALHARGTGFDSLHLHAESIFIVLVINSLC